MSEGLRALVVLAVALAVAMILMPVAVSVGKTLGLTVRPRLHGRRRGRRISYLGGIALGLSGFTGFTIGFGWVPEIELVFLGAAIVFVLGFVDDRRPRGLPPWVRLVVQAGAAAISWPYFSQFGEVLAVFAMFTLVAVTNAFNLIDNMDGVAGSTACGTVIGAGGLALVFGDAQAAALAAAIAGGCLGFLRFNFIRPRLYLGDGGAYLVGFLVAAAAVHAGIPFGPGWQLVAIVALLAVPATDGWVAITGRFLAGRSTIRAGTDHLSHRLVGLGFSPQEAAVAHGVGALVAATLVGLATLSDPQLLVLPVALAALGGWVVLARSAVYDRGPSHGLRRALVVVAMALLAVVLIAVGPTLAAIGHLEGARDLFTAGGETALEGNFDQAEIAFASAGSQGGAAKESLSSAYVYGARWLPLVGAHIRVVDSLAEASEQLGVAATEATSAVRFLGGDDPKVGMVGGKIDVAAWRSAAEPLSRAAAGANLALAAISDEGLVVPPLAVARDRLVTDLGEMVSTLESAQHLATLLPEVFGADSLRRWFLVIQNPVESRAGGGFLGAFGILEASDGQLSLRQLESNVGLPQGGPLPEMPEEFLARYERFEARELWQNTNMTPDFPTAAKLMSSKWELSMGESIDGVVAIDATGLSQLLQLTGLVTTPAGEEVTATNFIPLVLNEAYIRFPDKPDRVDFLLEVAREIWGKLLSGEFSDPREIASAFSGTTSGRHLQVWIPGKEEELSELGADGALEAPPEGEDFLMVVGQNAAANKVDYYAQREIIMRVDIDESGATEQLVTVGTHNELPEGMPRNIAGPYLASDPPGLNRTYLSVYRPGGLGLIGARISPKVDESSPFSERFGLQDTGMESHTEKGLSVYSKFVELESGQSQWLQTQHETSLVPGSYRLHVRPQAVLNPVGFKLTIVLPEGARVIELSGGLEVDEGPGTELPGPNVSWSGDLSEDRHFEVRYATGPLALLRSWLP